MLGWCATADIFGVVITGAVERWEDLAQRDHSPANTRRLLDDDDLQFLIGEVQGGLQAGNTAADDQDIDRFGRFVWTHLAYHERLPRVGKIVTLQPSAHGLTSVVRPIFANG